MNFNEPSTRTFTGAEFLVHALASAGVTHVFGGHGGAVVPLIDAIEQHPSVTWVYCRCEVNASQAAMAYAKLHGRLGCCIATSGPGAGHLLSGLVDADQDRVPVLCITGMKGTDHIRYADFQDIDQAAIFRMAGLALSEAVIDIHQLLPLTRNAVTLSLASNRVTHLAVPIDVQQEDVVARTHFCLGSAYQKKVAPPASRLEVGTLVMAIRAEIEAKRNVLIACGWRANSLGKEVERLAELLHAPILTSYDGKGTTDEAHPLAFGVVGVYGNAGTQSSVDLLEDCDTVISVCASDLTQLIANNKGLQVRRLIQIDQRLLAGDALRFSPSAVFSCGYLRDSLKRVVSELEKGIAMAKRNSYRLSVLQPEGTRASMRPSTGLDVWDEIKQEHFSKPVGTPSTFLDEKTNHNADDLVSSDFCHPAVFFGSMSKELSEDAIICADIGDNSLWMASSLMAKRGQRFLTSEHMGIMGFSVNAALAACVSTAREAQNSEKQPRQILAVAGDGGIQMSLNEIATLRDHGAVNVLVVVIVNKRLGRVQNETWGARLRADGCGLGSPDFTKLFDAYGYPNGVKLATSDSEIVSDTIKKGWASAREHGACVIELLQDPLVHPVMHKMTYAGSLLRRSQIDWEKLTRNSRTESLFPEIATHHWKKHQQMLQSWLNTLTKVEKSEPCWLDKEEFVDFSPSKAVQEQIDSLGHLMEGEKAPSLFSTYESREIFDSHFKSSFLNSFPAEVCASVLENGTSNGHPLCVQLLACPKDHNFSLHAHPNVELDIPLVGELWERRPLRVNLPETMFTRNRPLDHAEGKFFAIPSENDLEEIRASLKQRTVFQDLGKEGEFVTRKAKQGQVLYNPTGSVHQSFTKDKGCLLMVLWSDVHAHFEKENFQQKTGIDELVLK